MQNITTILLCLISISLSAQKTVRIYGKVTDKNNTPVDSASVWLKQNIDSLTLKEKKKIFDNSYETFTDKNGYFSMNVTPGTYYCMYAIKEKDYAKTKLEYWAWNLPIYEDLEINPKYDRMEIYGINAFEPQRGPYNTYLIYFRPMSLTKALALPKKNLPKIIDIAPKTITKEELTIKINGHKAEIVNITKTEQYIKKDVAIYAYLIQVLKPKNASPTNSKEMVKGHDKITIILNSKETNEMGQGEYFLKRVGN